MKEIETKTHSTEDSKKSSKVLKTVLNTIINIMIVIVLVTSILIAVMSLSSKANNGMSVVFGHTIESIQTNSMKGGSKEFEGGDFSQGDMIISKFTNYIYTNEYKVGDIVTYRSDFDGDGFLDNVCHRIIEVYDNNGVKCYRTKGDANNMADQEEGDYNSYLRATDIGSVFYSNDYQGKIIKGAGKVLDFLKTKQGFFLVVLLPMIIFFLYAVIRVVLTTMNYKKAKADEDKEEAVKAAVAAALSEQQANNKNGSDPTKDLTPEQLEQIKKYMESQKQEPDTMNTDNSEKNEISEDTENSEE